MSDALPAVRNHQESLERWARVAQERGDETLRRTWSDIASAVRTLIDDYERLKEANRPVPSDYGDISDLPPTLRRQLAFLRTDELDDQIYIIVKAAENGADLDAILIELWRRFKVEQTRRFIQNKAYRLAQKDVIHSVPGRKGVYAATAEAAERLSPVTHSSPGGLADHFDDLDLDEIEEAPSENDAAQPGSGGGPKEKGPKSMT